MFNFELVRKKLNDLGLNEKPSNIFNCDETGISADQGKKKVFFKKGDRSPNVIMVQMKNNNILFK